MPTATGRMTADEKREADRIRNRSARQEVTARITTPEWIAAEADRFAAGLADHKAAQSAGTIPAYHRFEQVYPAGNEYVVNRVKVDAGQAQSYGVGDELDRRGIAHHQMMSFGLFAGRQSIQYMLVAS